MPDSFHEDPENRVSASNTESVWPQAQEDVLDFSTTTTGPLVDHAHTEPRDHRSPGPLRCEWVHHTSDWII